MANCGQDKNKTYFSDENDAKSNEFIIAYSPATVFNQQTSGDLTYDYSNLTCDYSNLT